MWEAVGNAANIIQILSAIPLLWAAYLLRMRAGRFKRRMLEIETGRSAKPMALVVSLSGIEIAGQVRGYLESSKTSMPIRTLTRLHGITRDEIPLLLGDLLKLKREMSADGVTEVHLFMSCPIVFAAAVGAMLDNWVMVKAYHMNRESKTYEFWTPLYKGFVPGVDLADPTLPGAS